MIYKIQKNKRNYLTRKRWRERGGGGGVGRSDSEENGSLIGGTSFYLVTLWQHQEFLPHLLST